ncbi:hypothetical protein [Bacillus cereus group sp. IBL03679]|uniref:hypothetical protein n=1 Tax=Bacillus cereus group sp. IBL03679 TaxID=3240095 RepID=UPI003D2F645A
MRFKKTVATVLSTSILMCGAPALASENTQNPANNSHNTSTLASSSIQNSVSNLDEAPALHYTGEIPFFREAGNYKTFYTVHSPGDRVGQLRFNGATNFEILPPSYALYRVVRLSDGATLQEGRIGNWHPAQPPQFNTANIQETYGVPIAIEVAAYDNTGQTLSFTYN